MDEAWRYCEGKTYKNHFIIIDASCRIDTRTWVLTPTLYCDLAQGAGVSCGAGGKAHVLAGVVSGHVIQDEGTGTVRILDNDVVRVDLDSAAVCTKRIHMLYD